MSKEADPQAEGCHSDSEIPLLGACVNRACVTLLQCVNRSAKDLC